MCLGLILVTSDPLLYKDTQVLFLLLYPKSPVYRNEDGSVYTTYFRVRTVEGCQCIKIYRLDNVPVKDHLLPDPTFIVTVITFLLELRCD